MLTGLVLVVLLGSVQGPSAALPASAVEDPTALSIDELIERLPPVGTEWENDGGGELGLVPVAREFRDRVEHGRP